MSFNFDEQHDENNQFLAVQRKDVAKCNKAGVANY